MKTIILQANETALFRFWKRVDKTGICWLWTGSKNNRGYGSFQIGGQKSKYVTAHRFAFELHRGAVPPGKEIDHTCRNRACVNPGHLEAVTHAENLYRGNTIAAKNRAKTNCINGHQLSGTNLKPTRDGARRCRACANRINQAWKRRTRHVAN